MAGSGSFGLPGLPRLPRVRPTAIDGLMIVELAVHRDSRGSFKENWQRAAMVAAGLPDFSPVQHNVAFNTARGVTRGVHAEPWDKLVSVAAGRVFGAWADLRPGPGFGRVVTQVLDETTAVFVPRGVGNAYQTLTDGAVYSYLVNAHWSAAAGYTAVNPGDPALGIAWPIPLGEAELSEKDRAAPALADVAPIGPRRTLILGGTGQVGRALAALLPAADTPDRSALDLSDPAAVAAYDWSSYDTVINAAAHTDVDGAESPSGRRAAWAVNATGVAALAAACTRHRMTLVHLSTDYVFDGAAEVHAEDEPVAPLGGYGASKAAGELAVAATDRHYLVRTSWVVGEGRNFVATMAHLAQAGARPSVVDDQIGRLTFAPDLAAGIVALLGSGAPSGAYHFTNSGEPASWNAIARAVFAGCGRPEEDVIPVSTADYAAAHPGAAPRPRHSTLGLTRFTAATGITPRDHMAALVGYVASGSFSGLEGR